MKGFKKVTALLSMPASPSHKERLEKINKIGIPAEKPRNSIINARRSKNALKAETQPEACVVIRFLFSINYKCAYSNPSYNSFQDSLCNQFCFGDKNGKFA